MVPGKGLNNIQNAELKTLWNIQKLNQGRCLPLLALIVPHLFDCRSAVHASDSGAENLSASEEWTEPWLQHLPPETSPLYTHSLMCIEGWLRSLDFVQSVEDPALWTIKREDWHAELRLDVVDLLIR